MVGSPETRISAEQERHFREGAIVGVDPGINGAIAIVSREGALLRVDDMPKTKSRGRGHEVVWQSLAETLQAWDLVYGVGCAFVEQVQTRPGEGGASAFKFGYAAGGVRGILSTLTDRVTMVTPTKWKRAAGCTADKDYSRTRAVELFPGWFSSFARKKDNNRAEAALIAWYGAQQVRSET